MADPVGFLPWITSDVDEASPLIYQTFQRKWVEHDRQNLVKPVTNIFHSQIGWQTIDNDTWVTFSTQDRDFYIPKNTDTVRVIGQLDTANTTNDTDKLKVRFEINIGSTNYTGESGFARRNPGPQIVAFDLSRDISGDATEATRITLRTQVFGASNADSSLMDIDLYAVVFAYTTDDLN